MKMGVKNDILWSEIGRGFGEPGGTPPPKIPRSSPPGNAPNATIVYMYDKSC